MTGQLFVVPADMPEDPYVRLVLELADGREVRFRDIRKFGKVGLYGRDPVTGELVTEVGGAGVFAALGPGAAGPTRSRCATSGGASGAARAGSSRCCSTSRSSPASATSMPTRRSGRRGSIRCGPPGRSALADERRLYDAIRTVLAEAVERRGISIDDYTAPDGDGSMQERLAVYQRTGEPCPRCGRPIRRIVVGARADALLLVVPAAAGADRKGARGDPPRHDRRAPTNRRAALDRAAGGRGASA